MTDTAPTCPHCEVTLRKWAIPQNLPFDEAWHWVCFNDDCSYFVKGWQWMAEQYGRPCSYRYRRNPESGAEGPLAVWSKEALKDSLIEE